MKGILSSLKTRIVERVRNGEVSVTHEPDPEASENVHAFYGAMVQVMEDDENKDKDTPTS